MKIALINDDPGHCADRLGRFLQNLGADIYQSSNFSGQYDLLFVEASIKNDISEKINGAKIIFVDLEDCPSHFEPSDTFRALEDSALAYGKMVHRPSVEVSKLPQVALPIYQYLIHNELCHAPRIDDLKGQKYMVVAGTMIGNYTKKHPNGIGFDSNYKGDVKHFAEFAPGDTVFSQRVRWMLECEMAGVAGKLGIVYRGDSPEGLEFHKKHFGNIERFYHPQISYRDHAINCLRYGHALNPTGWDRISLRTYDLMAAGNIIYWTDTDDRLQLYMPENFIKVRDEQNIVEVLNTACLEDFKVNREILKDLTPEKVWSKFIKQLE